MEVNSISARANKSEMHAGTGRPDQELNIVIMAELPYPKGMAGTKRIQHAIDALRESNVNCSVIITRQKTEHNQPAGVYQGTPYLTVMPDLIGWRMGFFLPILIVKSCILLRGAFKAVNKNILFVYGPPSLSNIFTTLFARHEGYLIVFDIVEDEDCAMEIDMDWKHKIRTFVNRILTHRIADIADGIVVISSRLKEKFSRLTRGRVPLHVRPISIDPDRFRSSSESFSTEPKMIYSGSFGVKDGVPQLLDAFDRLAARHGSLRLIMTGMGSDKKMKETLARINASPARNRIEYLGYLDDEKYYAVLSEADIPCMTRVESDYANAGFPFKLGEFLGTGKPVIASNVSDIGGYLEDRQDVMLVKPGDTGEIEAAVEYLLSNPDIALKIGKRGREKALQLFDYRLQGRALMDFLHAV